LARNRALEHADQAVEQVRQMVALFHSHSRKL
jgi:hypothetical protein